MSATGCVAGEAEDAGELVLDRAGFGQHAVGSGPAALALVEQHGLADPGEFGEEFAHGHVQACPAGFQAHEVGDLQGEDAGEDVDADVVLGPVEHGAEGDNARVLELAESELGLGLGPVAGDDLGGWPVVMIGDEHVLAEQLLFEGGASVLVDGPGEAQVAGFFSVQLPGDDPPDPGLAGDRGDLGLDLVAGPAGLAAGEGGGQLAEFPAGLGQGGAVEPAGLAFVQPG